MALALKVIGPATVGKIQEFQFYPGEDITIKLQIIDTDSDDPVAIPSGASKELVLSATPDDFVIPDGSITVDPSDPSIFSTSLDQVQTLDLITGGAKFTFTAASITRIAVGELIMKRLNSSVG